MRVIGGSLGGRDLGSVPEGVRPTSDRVRESLFAILGPLEGQNVLDLFAGTGALGLEAYSRGATRVVFVERSRRIASSLRKRLKNLGLDAKKEDLRVLAMEAQKALWQLVEQTRETPEARFDLVLMDPPYAEGDRVGTLEAIFATGLLSDAGVVVVEGPKRHPLPPVTGGCVLDERTYGDTNLTWLAQARPTEE